MENIPSLKKPQLSDKNNELFHLSKKKLSTKSLVYVKFPKTGLGNMLLLWARATVFAELNNLELITSPWWGFRWGALLRHELKRRLYWNYFQESPLSKRLKARFYLQFRKVVVEPDVKVTPKPLTGNTVYLFNKIMTDYDLFGSVRNHHKFVAAKLQDSLAPPRKLELSKSEAPVIGLHIRRGDFKMGSIITPLEFFIKGINIIREQVGEEWPVTVFTDAKKDELTELLLLPGIKLAAEKADILDILLLSKSKVLLLSGGSTFSYWAAFLSGAFVIRPHFDWLPYIKNASSSVPGYFEIKWQFDDKHSTELFRENIHNRQLKSVNEPQEKIK